MHFGVEQKRKYRNRKYHLKRHWQSRCNNAIWDCQWSIPLGKCILHWFASQFSDLLAWLSWSACFREVFTNFQLAKIAKQLAKLSWPVDIYMILLVWNRYKHMRSQRGKSRETYCRFSHLRYKRDVGLLECQDTLSESRRADLRSLSYGGDDALDPSDQRSERHRMVMCVI